MAESNTKTHRDSIPESFDTIEEFWEFWDTHSLADYEEVLKEVDVEIDLRVEKNYVALEQDLARKVSEIADTRGISSETLVNLWLKEKVLEPA